MLPVALFFLACEDESSLLGFKNPNTKFENYSVEIPLESSVLLLDSIRTSNYYLANDVNRLLVGRYEDPEFGTTTSTGIAQFITATGEKLPAGALLQSVELRLAYDLYFYGSETPKDQTFYIRKVLDDLDRYNRNKYLNRTTVLLSEPISTRTLSIHPQAIRENYIPPGSPAPAPQPDTLIFDLPKEEFTGVWDIAKAWAESGDSTFLKIDNFVSAFKGLAIEPGAENSIMMGFSIGSFTQLVLRYDTDTKTNQRLVFTINSSGLLSYNNIVTDRSASSLSGITKHTDFLPGTGYRYAQAGTGIVTKINLDKFLEFADTIGSNVIINEARLVIEGVEVSDAVALRPPAGFAVRAVTAENKYRYMPDIRKPGAQDSADFRAFRGTIRTDRQTVEFGSQINAVLESDFAGFMASDEGSGAFVQFNETQKTYSGTPTLFFQQLYLNRMNPVFKDFVLYPLSTTSNSSGPSGLKTVNRAVFPADKIYLRVKYTKPTVNE